MTILVLLSLFLLFLGILEQRKHKKNLSDIPIRIHVNGTRGKSTTTRLIAGGLREAGLRVLAKTTGSAARIIFEDGKEKPVNRRGRANIIEQKRIVALAAQRHVNALVIECMAIHPEIQWVSEHRLIRSTIGVITNVRPDHLDEMGQTLSDIAETLSLTIPEHGTLVTAEREFLPTFSSCAQKKGTSVCAVKQTDISDRDLQYFPSVVFRENIACAVTVCELLGIPRDTALRGMRKAAPDPGITEVRCMTLSGKKFYLINAFAANDLTSTRMVWELWKTQPSLAFLRELPVIGLFNNRSDRGFRIKELSALITTEGVRMERILLLGQMKFVARHRLKQAGVHRSVIQPVNISRSINALLEIIRQSFHTDLVLFGFGNIQDAGQKIVTYFEKHGEKVL